MTESVTTDTQPPSGAFHTVGTGAPSADTRPVGDDDRAVIAVFDDLDGAQDAVERLAAVGFPIDRISIIGEDLQSQIRVNRMVTTGDIAGLSAANGAWVGGMFGLLAGTALLFVPGAGPLIVLGLLAAVAVGAVEGALIGGGVGAVLGHFVSKKHIPKYEGLVQAGSYLVVAHGGEDEVARAQQILSDSGSTDVQRHDAYRGPTDRIGPIEQVREGMRGVDADGKEIGKIKLVKQGDPDAITTQGQDLGVDEPDVGSPFAARLLHLGFTRVGRKGLFTDDVYADVIETERVEDSTVHLAVPEDALLPAGELARSAG